MQLNFLSERIFKINPAYELVEAGNLDQPEQSMLAGLLTREDVFGVFRPREMNELNYKVAYKDVALLYYFLQHPSKLPLHLRNHFDDEANNTMAKLVMEGILEIEQNGNFFSGLQARPVIFKTQRHEEMESRSYISKLSEEAICYVLSLKHTDMSLLARRLYSYNTIPSLQKHDDLTSLGEVREWTAQEPTKKYNWLSWSRGSNGFTPSDHSTYKLYISPRPEDLAPVFKKTIPVISRMNAFSFKTGADRQGLLRPDKFIVYFYSYKDLRNAATILEKELKEFSPQGVPFTSQLDDSGLLSWGIDPAKKDVIENIEAGSWREKITVKLASAILQTRKEVTEKSNSLSFIMDLVQLENIDPLTWTPLN